MKKSGRGGGGKQGGREKKGTRNEEAYLKYSQKEIQEEVSPAAAGKVLNILIVR